MTVKQLLFTILLIPFLVACSGNVQIRLDENYSYLTITMDEENTENLIETLLTSGESRLQNVVADLRNGEIYVTADASTQNNGIQSGNLIVYIGVEDGLLDVEIRSFNFGGYSVNQAGIDNFNTRLADSIARNAENRENDSEFTDVTITPTGLSFTIRTPRRNNQ